MSQKLAPLLAITLALACGGTTQGSSEGGDGGNGQGGNGQGGRNTGGSSSAGTHTGGSASAGAGGAGGSIVSGGDGGVGGALSYDPRCPARVPSGPCSFEPALNCEYHFYTGCLCYNSPNMYSICQQVDPTCMYEAGGAGGAAAGGAGGAAAGASGAAQMAAPAPSEAGTGGISFKVALPPQKKCLCSPPPPGSNMAGMWTCTL
jgi:hypothetical protein